MITKIIASFYAFLVFLFPWSPIIQSNYQMSLYIGRTAITENIIDAVKTNDTKAIEDMLSKSAKKRLENTNEKINEFFKSIDGEILEAKFYAPGTEKIRQNFHFDCWEIEFKTKEETYYVMVNWVIKDGENPDNFGLSSMSTRNSSKNLIYELY